MLQTLGRYQLIEPLGEGGMGVVYRATDPRLERDVAIKVLRDDLLRNEDARRRFRQEARALSRLNHPHIATLFDLDSQDGHEYLVLEFVPGETLSHVLESGALPESRARAIALEVAAALAAAHELGLIHRDLKPGNVMITPRGHAKVLDFGLARFVAETGDSHADTSSQPGLLVGTLPYLAPEQVRGERVDARTDLHALGAILYEMTTGRRPFTGDTPGNLLYQIAHADPAPLGSVRAGLSHELQEIVGRCLAKTPSHRFADGAALIRALEAAPSADRSVVSDSGRAALNAARRIRAIAVLPFANRSGAADQEFFADGMTDALITDLAQIGALRVISRTSAMRFKGSTRALPEIAQELGVDAVVEGSALHAGDRIRISVQLVDARSDASLWARSYERALTDILTLQSEVAGEIAREVAVKLTPEEHARLVPKGPVNADAHLAYLHGRASWNRWTPEALQQSIAHFEQALAADPDYALAYAGLADSYSILGNTNALPPAVAYSRAREAATRGLELDESLAELHASLAYVHRYFDWDWPRAEREFLRALELNPGYANCRRWYAQFLSGMGRHPEAIAEAEKAFVMDPLSLINHTGVGDVYFYARRYEQSMTYYRRCIAMDPTFGPGHTDLARSLEHEGRYDEALAEFLAVTPLRDGRPAPATGLAVLLMRAGRREEAETMMATLVEESQRRFVSPYGIASYYAVAGNNVRAIDWLERAYETRDGTLVWIKVHPRLDGMRGEPRFRDLLQRMRLDA